SDRDWSSDVCSSDLNCSFFKIDNKRSSRSRLKYTLCRYKGKTSENNWRRVWLRSKRSNRKRDRSKWIVRNSSSTSGRGPKPSRGLKPNSTKRARTTNFRQLDMRSSVTKMKFARSKTKSSN